MRLRPVERADDAEDGEDGESDDAKRRANGLCHVITFDSEPKRPAIT